MPELPEVETVVRGLKSRIENQIIQGVILRHSKLRWPIPAAIKTDIKSQKVLNLKRRGKYLLFYTKNGAVILHLGMSGSLAIVSKDKSPNKHDHVDFIFKDFCLRYTDPRRFGALLWTSHDPMHHPLLAHLGPEPLGKNFTGSYLYQIAQTKQVCIKQLIMNSKIVVGVGNIYANESLFFAGILPTRIAGTLTLDECNLLSKKIKSVLRAAIKQGGTTLRNFVTSEGKPGYFKQKLSVYGRNDLPCKHCHQVLKSVRIQNRATVYCDHCQK